MTSFIPKKLSSGKTVPEIIRDERIKNKLSLSEVSFKTQISEDYLNDLEDGIYHKLPGEIYTKQFLKSLAKTYSLNESALLKLYQKEKESQLSFQLIQKLPSKASGFKKILNYVSPKFASHLLVAALIMAFLGYLGWEIKNIFRAPVLELAFLDSQMITSDEKLKIIGQTEPEVNLTINNQTILPDTEGNFIEEVDLNKGLNTFTIAAKKEHSKEKAITISILRQ